MIFNLKCLPTCKSLLKDKIDSFTCFSNAKLIIGLHKCGELCDLVLIPIIMIPLFNSS